MSTKIHKVAVRDMSPIVAERDAIYRRIGSLSKAFRNHHRMFGWDSQTHLIWKKLCAFTHRYRDRDLEMREFWTEQPVGFEALSQETSSRIPVSLDSRIRGGL